MDWWRSIVAVVLVAGCLPKEDETQNVLVASTGSSVETTTTTTPMTTTTAMVDFGSGGPETMLPGTWRFECVDIQGVGDGDGTVIQAQVLENTWSADINNFKLNIMLEVVDRDGEAGTANLGIRSGVGPDASSLCVEPTSATDVIEIEWVEEQVLWEPTAAPGECSVPSTRTDGGTYHMALPIDRVVYIYAEDDNTVTFNCTPDAGTPDAVPVRAVEAQVSTNADETVVAGRLTGCLIAREAQGLCSCLAQCAGNMGPGDLQTEGVCAGCPTGGVPLDVLLGDVGASQRCSDLAGEDAYDLVLGFTARRLPNVPTTCE